MASGGRRLDGGDEIRPQSGRRRLDVAAHRPRCSCFHATHDTPCKASFACKEQIVVASIDLLASSQNMPESMCVYTSSWGAYTPAFLCRHVQTYFYIFWKVYTSWIYPLYTNSSKMKYVAIHRYIPLEKNSIYLLKT